MKGDEILGGIRTNTTEDTDNRGLIVNRISGVKRPRLSAQNYTVSKRIPFKWGKTPIAYTTSKYDCHSLSLWFPGDLAIEHLGYIADGDEEAIAGYNRSPHIVRQGLTYG